MSKRDLIEVNGPMQVTIAGRPYGISNEGTIAKGLAMYPPKGITIPQMADTKLKVAFQRNRKAVEIRKGEMGLIPGVWGCEAVVLVHHDKSDGFQHVSLVHNTAAILLPDDALYNTIIQRRGGDQEKLPELKIILGKNLQEGFSMGEETMPEKEVNRLLKDVNLPLFDQILVVAPETKFIGNILKHYTRSFSSVTTEVQDKKTKKPMGGFNMWVYNNGNSLQYVLQYQGANEETYAEIEIVQPPEA